MNKSGIPTSPDDLADMTCIVSVSSYKQGKRAWTDLSIWYRKDHSKPFVSVIEGKVFDGEVNNMNDRFRAVTCGTFDRALNVFEASDLQAQLLRSYPGDVVTRFPDGDTSRMIGADARRAQRFYCGPDNLSAALAWLYPDLAAGSDNALATQFESDFGVGSRTVRNLLTDERAGKAPTTWATAFIAALRFFDITAWRLRA